MTPTPGSTTPEGKPSAREVAHDAMAEADRLDTLKVRSLYGHWNLEAPCGPLCDAITAAIEQDRARRDALHAETLRQREAALRADFAEAIVNVLALEMSFWPRDREEIAAKIITEVTRIRAATAQAMKEGTP